MYLLLFVYDTGVPKPEGFGPVSEKPVVVQHSHRAEIQHLAFIHTSGGGTF
jgi:hypothetical protein